MCGKCEVVTEIPTFKVGETVVLVKGKISCLAIVEKFLGYETNLVRLRLNTYDVEDHSINNIRKPF